MNVYQDDPHLALTSLEKIAEEIPSGVSAADIGDMICNLGPNSTKVAEEVHAVIVDALKKNLKIFWDTQNVNEKLEGLKNLAKHDLDLGTRLSQQELLNTITAKHLRQLKDTLAEKVKKVEEENQSLEESLRTKSQLINKQISAVKSQDFSL